MAVSVPLRASCRLVSIKHSGKEGSQTGAIDRKSWNLGETLQWVASKSVCLSPFGHHGLGGYNSRHLFLTGLKAGMPRIKAPADSAPASLVRRWSSAGGCSHAAGRTRVLSGFPFIGIHPSLGLPSDGCITLVTSSIIFQRPRLQIPTRWGIGFSVRIWQGTQTFRP